MGRPQKFSHDSLYRHISQLQRSGIYYIYNNKNNKYYVGSSCNIFKRLRSHINSLDGNKHHNANLQKDWKDGDWSYALLCICEIKDLLKYESLILNIFSKNLLYNKTPANLPMPKTINEKRFWSKVEKTDGCWLWIGSKNIEGYGQCKCNNKDYNAHRISYYLATGDDPKYFIIRHKCENKSCVNPDHLCVGSYQDNANDVRQTVYDINQIRYYAEELGYNSSRIAKIIGCHSSSISNIAKKEGIIFYKNC